MIQTSATSAQGLFRPDGKIRTASGIYIDPFKPKINEITIEDIAHGLTNVCRFGGHTKEHFSVAQHSLMVCDSLPPEHRLAGLMHDAPETYLGDMPTPIKKGLPGYKEAENYLMHLIAEKFGFQYPLHPLVKEADNAALIYEWDNMVVSHNIGSWHPKYTKTLFLWRFRELTEGRI